MRRTIYVPLMLSLPFSLALTGAAIVAIAFGWFPPGAAAAVNGTHWADALTLIPQISVLCIGACWLIAGVSLPLSRTFLRSGRA